MTYNHIYDEIYISKQLEVKNFESSRIQSFKKIIDLRPDGESKDQLSSKEIRELAEKSKIEFVYIPIPHGKIPDEKVEELSEELAKRKPNDQILLFCRTGNRAMRALALYEASKPIGKTLDQIQYLAVSNGFELNEIEADLKERIALRKNMRMKND